MTEISATCATGEAEIHRQGRRSNVCAFFSSVIGISEVVTSTQPFPVSLAAPEGRCLDDMLVGHK